MDKIRGQLTTGRNFFFLYEKRKWCNTRKILRPLEQSKNKIVGDYQWNVKINDEKIKMNQML